MKYRRPKFILFVLLILTILGESTAFTLIVKSDAKLRLLKIVEHISTKPLDLEIGSNEIQLVNYPNAVYLMELRSASNFKYLPMLWVPSDTSVIEITVDAEYNVTFHDENPSQVELNKIFVASNKWSVFPYEPEENKPLEPILALEAKALIQNLKATTKTEVLENLYRLSQQRKINNWSTNALSRFVTEPTDNFYSSGKLKKVFGLDGQENRVEIAPDNKKYMLIAISGSWCGPCVKGIPNLRKSYDEVSDKILFVSLWNDPNLETFTDNHRDKKKFISWPSLWDEYGLMANALEIRAYPTYLLFDPEGTEVKRWEVKIPKDLKSEIN